ncbi:MAG TPA: NBR1-Ig-like domain-containing protein [Anaerolineae bacterium]|nr:NBR1-Ig-like domain-containing protein [Anaerolineae bacterium]
MSELIGTVLGGRYRIDTKLGSGGQGTVYKGMHLALNMPVAIKILPTSASEDRTSRTRFVREARRAASLQHPHIVHVFDYAVEEGRYYIVSQFIEGTDLKKMIRASGGPMPIDQALEYAGQIGEALQFAHDREIIHRDIKPANILIDSQTKRAALCDFGLARMMEGDALEVTSERGGMPGTPAYMSPEQCQGLRLDQRTDIYSLAIVVYEMLTGQNPFRGEHDTSASIIYKQVNESPPPPRSLNARLSPQVDEVLLKALAKDRDKRYQTVTRFVNALDEAVQGKLKPTPTKPKKAFAVPPWIALLLAGVAIIVVVALVPGPRDYLVDWWQTLARPATATLVATRATAVASPTTAASAGPGPVATSPPVEDEGPPREGTLGSIFVADVTVPEGALLSPGEPFVKVWRIRNSGLRPWPPGVHLAHVDGHPMGGEISPPLEREVPPGEEVEIELPLMAPREPGEHAGLWQLRIPEGELFGTKLRVVVEVVFSEEAPAEGALGSVFVEDVTIPEGALLSPGESFVKVWRIRNSGLRPWPPGVHLVLVDGHPMGREISPPLEREVPPGEEVEIELPLMAPREPGEHAGLWQLRSPEGEFFGTELRIIVEVVPSEEAPAEGTLGSIFVADVTIPEGALLSPGEPFVKVWRIRNSGLRPWPPGVHLVLVDGHPMGREISPPLEREVRPGEEVEIELPLMAPREPGEHAGLWQLRIPEVGFFGTKLRVVVEVVLFRDDFSDPDSGWPREADERRALVCEGGMYIILANEPGTLFRALAPIEMLEDFVLEVDVELLGEPRPAAFGVVFRHQDVYNTYAFLIRNNGQYGVWKRVNDEAGPIGGPEWTSSPHIRRTGLNRLRVVCEGPHIALFVNDQHLRTVVDESFLAGRVGLCASLGEEGEPIEVAFDNVVVRLP